MEQPVDCLSSSVWKKQDVLQGNCKTIVVIRAKTDRLEKI